MKTERNSEWSHRIRDCIRGWKACAKRFEESANHHTSKANKKSARVAQAVIETRLFELERCIAGNGKWDGERFVEAQPPLPNLWRESEAVTVADAIHNWSESETLIKALREEIGKEQLRREAAEEKAELIQAALSAHLQALAGPATVAPAQNPSHESAAVAAWSEVEKSINKVYRQIGDNFIEKIKQKANQPPPQSSGSSTSQAQGAFQGASIRITDEVSDWNPGQIHQAMMEQEIKRLNVRLGESQQQINAYADLIEADAKQINDLERQVLTAQDNRIEALKDRDHAMDREEKADEQIRNQFKRIKELEATLEQLRRQIQLGDRLRSGIVQGGTVPQNIHIVANKEEGESYIRKFLETPDGYSVIMKVVNDQNAGQNVPRGTITTTITKRDGFVAIDHQPTSSRAELDAIATHLKTHAPQPAAEAQPQASDGYRLLVEGEKIEKGDEFFYLRGPWEAVKLNIGREWNARDYSPHRRRVEPATDPKQPQEPPAKTEESTDQFWNPEANPSTASQQPQPPEAGAGWRMLTTGENMQAGDQYWHDGQWLELHEASIGWEVQPSEFGRRPDALAADPKREHAPQEDKWRALAVGEVINEGDQFWNAAEKRWVNAEFSVGAEVREDHQPWRRRVSAEPQQPPVTEAGEGYRLLVDGDTIAKGDQIWQRGAFVNVLTQHEGVYYRPEDGWGPVRRKLQQPAAEAAPDPGTGYRLLRHGETIQSGDEFWNEGVKQWIRAYAIGDMVMTGRLPYRRRHSPPPTGPGEGYRLLEKTETIKARDEFWNYGGQCWQATENAGCKAGEVADFYRRKIEPDQSQPATEPPPSSISPGNGYRLLKQGERIKKGDEWWSKVHNEWSLTDDVGRTHNCSMIYRRPMPVPKAKPQPPKQNSISVGVGYRLLKDGENIHPNDQWWDGESKKWEKTVVLGNYHDDYSPMRRRIPTTKRQRRQARARTEAVAGEGYRALKHGQRIKAGDEWQSDEGWEPVTETIGELFSAFRHSGHRRPLTKTQRAIRRKVERNTIRATEAGTAHRDAPYSATGSAAETIKESIATGKRCGGAASADNSRAKTKKSERPQLIAARSRRKPASAPKRAGSDAVAETASDAVAGKRGRSGKGGK